MGLSSSFFEKDDAIKRLPSLKTAAGTTASLMKTYWQGAVQYGQWDFDIPFKTAYLALSVSVSFVSTNQWQWNQMFFIKTPPTYTWDKKIESQITWLMRKYCIIFYTGPLPHILFFNDAFLSNRWLWLYLTKKTSVIKKKCLVVSPAVGRVLPTRTGTYRSFCFLME